MKRRQRETGKSHELKREIPFDLVIEILTRLPAKSLMRFKSVAKLWSSLICSQYFTNRLLKVASSTPRMYMCLGFFENSNLKPIVLSSSSDTDLTMSSYEADQDLTTPAMKGYISHVFRGLMCFVDGSRAQIYNTTTRQHVVLPDIEESKIIADDQKAKKIMYNIGYDPVHDQYKVVCIVARASDEVGEFTTFVSEHWVLLLGGEVPSRWRNIPCGSPPHIPVTQGLTINGSIHYLAWVHVACSVLMSFDMISEEISMLQVPEGADWLFADLIEYGGKLAILHYFDLIKEGVMGLWVMEDAMKNKWSRKKTFVLHPSQMHLVNGISRLRVGGTTRNGEVILLPPTKSNISYILFYDLDKNHMRRVEMKGTPQRHLTKFFDIVVGLDDVENLLFIKT